MTRPRITVQQGCIHVNCVGILASHKDAFVLEIDCQQKYPVVEMMGGNSVYLGFNEHTIHVEDRGADFTRVEWKVRGKWWFTVSAGRYSVHVSAVRKGRPPRDSLIWPEERP